MKLALVSYTYWPPDFGGELLHSIERFQALSARGHDITVLTSGRKGYQKNEVVNGLRVLRSPVIHESRPGRAIGRLVYLIWVLRRLSQSQANAVHIGSLPGLNRASSWMAGCLTARAAKRSGAATVWVHSLADGDEAPFDVGGDDSRWKLSFFKWIDRIVGVSPGLAKAVAGVFPEKSVGITYGIRSDVFRPLESDVRRVVRGRFGVGRDDVVFCFAGSVTTRKGFDVLSEAFCELERRNSNWHLWVIGPTTHAENQNLRDEDVNGLADNLRQIPNVTFWGRVDSRKKLAELLAASDIFVFPSRREGMGLTPAEAMGCGTPVIVSRIPGVTDTGNVEGETGFYITPGDAHDLVNAMNRLGEDPSLRKRMGKAGSKRARDVFGWRDHVSRWEDLYRSLRASNS